MLASKNKQLNMIKQNIESLLTLDPLTPPSFSANYQRASNVLIPINESRVWLLTRVKPGGFEVLEFNGVADEFLKTTVHKL